MDDTHYAWFVRDAEAERLLVPRGDPHKYEQPADLLFSTRGAAERWRAEELADWTDADEDEVKYIQSWVLCTRTITPVDQPDDRPLVLVIETPEEDPTVVASDGVEVWEESSYPSTKWAYGERKDGTYDDYPGGCRQMAREAERRGATDIAEALRQLADEFEEAVARDRGRD